ncbi:MAG TPA: hypothetical protein ENH23_01195 [candidate division Zixibacteria bacterium]|nr:hypothetical protein [candidate division Zixibacteria bacterium]
MIKIPDTNSIYVIADWIELYIATTKNNVSKTKMSSLLERASGEEPREQLISDIWCELGIRQNLYENSPFVIDRLVVEPKANIDSEVTYLACLLIALYGPSNSNKNIAKLFERLSCLAIEQYLNGEGIVFGWPVESGEETSIRERIIKVASRLNERYVESPRETYKDRGVDVVAWKPFGESRNSQVIVLLQCASGKNWQNKTTDLPLNAWEQYIHWSNNPIRAFAVPCVIPSRNWHEVSKEGGILFDRIRITNLIGAIESKDKCLAGEVASFVKNRLEETSN